MFSWEIGAVTLNKNGNNSGLDGAGGGCMVEKCCSVSFRTPGYMLACHCWDVGLCFKISLSSAKLAWVFVNAN